MYISNIENSGTAFFDLTKVKQREGYVDVVLLTKSFKNGGYCVAGIDLHTHEWVRLTASEEDFPGGEGALGENNLFLADGTFADVLDVVRFRSAGTHPELYQVENTLVDFSERMMRLGTMRFEEVLEIHPAEGRKKLFYTDSNTLPDYYGGRLDYSLILAHVKNAHIYSYYDKGKTRWKADFTYVSRYKSHSTVEYKEVYVTTPINSLRDKLHYDDAYFVLSVGMPFNGTIYKFVAAIFEREYL